MYMLNMVILGIVVMLKIDINTLFQQASSRSYSEEDPYFDRLTIKLEAGIII